MTCERCGVKLDPDAPAWCVDCERIYDAWVRQYAADIIWQVGSGAGLAMVIALALPLLGVAPLIGVGGVLAGAATFVSLRQWGKRRRRRQFLVSGLPRAYVLGAGTTSISDAPKRSS